ncbi:MAG: 50S ribosomal protein L13 [Alphaproteobacteria bacterium]|nr:50S ribosomal protein L13 [Alphaproteobacteria bacterium]
MTKQTYFAKGSEVKNNWYVVDAEDVVLGRLASQVAIILRGKHKPSYTPNLHGGDNVVIINAGKVKLTGRKAERKVYYRHTGFAGGIKQTTPEKILAGKAPGRVIRLAILRMLPKEGVMRRKQYKSLYVYPGSEHPHEAQQPQVLNLAAKNTKNKRPQQA